MADNTARKLEEVKAEELRVSSLDRLYNEAKDDADVLAHADVTLITVDTRARIANELSDHRDLFTSLYRPEGVSYLNEDTRKAAFAKAFEAVYGKFTLEQKRISDIEKPDGVFLRVLGDVAKFRFEKAGIAGRNELEVLRDVVGRVTSANGSQLHTKIVDKFKADRGNHVKVELKEVNERRADKVTKRAEAVQRINVETTAINNNLTWLNQHIPKLEADDLALDQGIANIGAEIAGLDNEVVAANSRIAIIDGDIAPIEASRLARKTFLGKCQEEFYSSFTSAARTLDDVLIPPRAKLDANRILSVFDGAVSEIALIVGRANDSLLNPGFDLMEHAFQHMKSTTHDEPGVGPVIDYDEFRNFMMAVDMFSISFKDVAGPAVDARFESQLKPFLDQRSVEVLTLNSLNDEKTKKEQELNKFQVDKDHGLSILAEYRTRRDSGTARLADLATELAASNVKFDGEIAADDIAIAELQAREVNPKVEDVAGWLVESSFRNSKTSAEIKELTRKHADTVSTKAKVAGTYEYFAKDENLDGFSDRHNLFAQALAGMNLQNPTGKNGTVESFKTQLTRATRSIEVTQEQLKNLSRPNDYDSANRAKARSEETRGLKDLERKSSEALRQLQNDKRRDPNSVSDQQIANAEAEVKRANDLLSKNLSFDEKTDRENRQKAYETERDGFTEKLTSDQSHLDALRNIVACAEPLHNDIKRLLQNMEAASKFGIIFGGLDVFALVAEFRNHGFNSPSFDPVAFRDFSKKLFDHFSHSNTVDSLRAAFDKELANSEDAINKAKSALDAANEEANGNKNLSDTAIARRVITTIVGINSPDLNLGDQINVSRVVLAEGLEKLQTDKSSREIAWGGTASLLDVIQQSGFREKLLYMKYKEGDKVVEPFKGLKIQHFASWEALEKFFDNGKLDFKAGLILLAGFKQFEQGNMRSLQSIKLERKVKKMMASDPKIALADRMDEAGGRSIINEIYKSELEGADAFVGEYFDYSERNFGDWKKNKIRELDYRYEELTENMRLGKMKESTFQKRYEQLVDEAGDYGVENEVSFEQDSFVSEFWNSPEAQWVRDLGYNVGRHLLRKTGALAASAVSLGASGLWGATKLTANLGLQAGLMPFRLAKYPLMLAGKVLTAPINLFRTTPLIPINITHEVKTDVGRVWEFAKTTTVENAKGAVAKVVEVPKAKLEAVIYDSKKYADRTRVKAEALAEEIKELKEKADMVPLEIAGLPFGVLDKYQERVNKFKDLAKSNGSSAAPANPST